MRAAVVGAADGGGHADRLRRCAGDQPVAPRRRARCRQGAGATGGFDGALPLIAETVENQLIRERPDLYEQIKTATIDAVREAGAAPHRPRQRRRPRLGEGVHRGRTEGDRRVLHSRPPARSTATPAPRSVSDSFQVLSSWSDRVGDELTDKVKEDLKQQGIDF